MGVGHDDADVDAKVPGESLGFYVVKGRLGQDTCGAESLRAPSDWGFEVKLSRDGSALYWLNGREAIVGEIDKGGKFGFETHLDLPLREKRGAAKGCTIVRRDSAEGLLAASGASFSAALSFGYEQTSSSDCSEWTAAAEVEGVPQALPCRLEYSLEAERVSE